jgi:hypothetical protein
MATKRDVPAKKKAKKKTVEAPSAGGEVVDTSNLAVTKATSVDGDPDVRRQLIAMEAYYLAERRGFVAGHEDEDWIAAEAVIRSRDSLEPG